MAVKRIKINHMRPEQVVQAIEKCERNGDKQSHHYLNLCKRLKQLRAEEERKQDIDALNITDAKKEVMKTIRALKKATVKTIAEALGRANSTIRKHVAELSDEGLIEKHDDNVPAYSL